MASDEAAVLFEALPDQVVPERVGGGAPRLRQAERGQIEWRPFSLDQLVPEDHRVRLVWQFVAELDLTLLLVAIKAVEGQAGHPPADPRILVALWLYATVKKIGSARELARLCEEHIAFRWLCGGVSMNAKTLADFRVNHGDVLERLLADSFTALVRAGVASLDRVAQDGMRVRASAGAASFRRHSTLEECRRDAEQAIADLRAQVEADPGAATRQQAAARQRAVAEREQRVRAALAVTAELQAQQQEQARRDAERAAREAERAAKQVPQDATKAAKSKTAAAEPKKPAEPRASTTDPEARTMKMADGGFRPAVNVQLATDTASRAILGVEVINAGVDAGQLEPMRKQVEDRSGGKVREHLADGGYLTFDDVDAAAAQDVTLYLPPKPPRDPEKNGTQYEPRKSDSAAVKDWRQRMGTGQAREIYKERAATSETVNADLTGFRGLVQLTVRGLAKARCAALWCALAYNLMHFGRAMLA